MFFTMVIVRGCVLLPETFSCRLPTPCATQRFFDRERVSFGITMRIYVNAFSRNSGEVNPRDSP